MKIQLIINPATLINSLTILRSFGENVPDFLSRSSCNLQKDSFASSFSIWKAFNYFCFPCLPPLVNLERNVEWKWREQISCLVTDHKGKEFSFSPLRTMLVLGFAQMLFFRFRMFSFIPALLRALISNGRWILSSDFSEFLEMTSWFFLFHLLVWQITWLNQPRIHGINPILSCCIVLLL